eukprot:7376145-Prymnesium_polylepis.1
MSRRVLHGGSSRRQGTGTLCRREAHGLLRQPRRARRGWRRLAGARLRRRVLLQLLVAAAALAATAGTGTGTGTATATATLRRARALDACAP